MLINNIYSFTCSNRMSKIKKEKEKAMEKISSGLKINTAADDASGLAISESFRSQVRGLSRAERNIQEGISMVQVTDGALDDITKQLHKMKELAVNGATDTLSDEDRETLNKEFSQLKDSIDTMSNNTQFNGIKLLDSDKTLSIQIRDNPYASYELKLSEVSLKSIGLSSTDVISQDNASDAISQIDNALNKITSVRTHIGAANNDLAHALNNTINSNSNITSSLSGIRDVNVASSLMGMVKGDVLSRYSEMMYSVSKTTIESVKKFI